MSESLLTVDRALQLLVRVASKEEDGWTLAELCRATGSQKTTTLRMLASLEKNGYVDRSSPDGRYRVGPTALALGGSMRWPLREAARPELRRLTQETGETSLLSIRSGSTALCIEKVDSPHPVRVAYDVGTLGPLHTGSAGKVLLAFMAADDRGALIAASTLEPRTPRSISTKEELVRDLDQSVQRGYVRADGELDLDINAVGAPVWDSRGRLAAGVTLAAPAMRWSDERTEAFTAATIAAAARLSRRLGFVGRRPAAAAAEGAA